MKKLLDLGNRYARKSSWKDFALVKFCLFSMGVAFFYHQDVRMFRREILDS